MLLTLLIQNAVLFLNLLDILLVFRDLATQRLYAFGGLFQYLCSASLKYDRVQKLVYYDFRLSTHSPSLPSAWAQLRVNW